MGFRGVFSSCIRAHTAAMGSNGRLALSFCASHPKETDHFEWWWGFANALSGLEAGEIARISIAYRVLLMVPVFPLPAES
jgi:hypothetical protein